MHSLPVPELLGCVADQFENNARKTEFLAACDLVHIRKLAVLEWQSHLTLTLVIDQMHSIGYYRLTVR